MSDELDVALDHLEEALGHRLNDHQARIFRAELLEHGDLSAMVTYVDEDRAAVARQSLRQLLDAGPNFAALSASALELELDHMDADVARGHHVMLVALGEWLPLALVEGSPLFHLKVGHEQDAQYPWALVRAAGLSAR